jgi:hypothetical protein
MERIITDKAGRKFSLRKMGLVETLRLYTALGPELSANDAYMGMATIAASVAILDGVPLPFPNSEAAVENLVERIGRDGAAAVSAAIQPEAEEGVVAQAGN